MFSYPILNEPVNRLEIYWQLSLISAMTSINYNVIVKLILSVVLHSKILNRLFVGTKSGFFEQTTY